MLRIGRMMVENMVQYVDDGLTGHIKDIVHS